MADDDAGFFVKLGLSAIAVIAFIFPEPASSTVGIGVLGAIWGLDLLDGGGS